MRETSIRRATSGALVATALFGGGCSMSGRSAHDTSAASAAPAGASATTAATATTDSGWKTLFDGTSTAAFRGFRKPEMPAGWTIVDGALTRTAEGGDIITRDQYGNFELTLEWNISPGGNSGIMYHVTEAADQTYMTGPEMQVLDDAKHPDGKSRLTSAGAAYALYPAPTGAVKPPGEWNTVRILVRDGHVEQWLNGVSMARYDLNSDEFKAKVKASKFAEWPGFGRSPRGHIALQDHGDRVAFRNIRIRALD